jgi:SAM-dependent methyltransferase
MASEPRTQSPTPLRARSITPPPGASILQAHPPGSPEFTFLEFAAYFPHVPTSLAVIECVRMKELPVIGPVLDIGCGDGLFTSLAYPEVEVWGIDVNERIAARAQASRAYSHVICKSITESSPALPAEFFATCIANSSLEHIPDLDSALATIRRAIRPGGLFYLIVPRGRDWMDTFPLRRAMDKLRLSEAGRAYAATLDARFAHHHLYDADEWAARLHAVGFVDVESEVLGTDGSQAAFEAWLLPSMMGYLSRRLTGRWVLAPGARSLYAWPVFQTVRRLLETRSGLAGPELLIVCRAPASRG